MTKVQDLSMEEFLNMVLSNFDEKVVSNENNLAIIKEKVKAVKSNPLYSRLSAENLAGSLANRIIKELFTGDERMFLFLGGNDSRANDEGIVEKQTIIGALVDFDEGGEKWIGKELVSRSIWGHQPGKKRATVFTPGVVHRVEEREVERNGRIYTNTVRYENIEELSTDDIKRIVKETGMDLGKIIEQIDTEISKIMNENTETPVDIIEAFLDDVNTNIKYQPFFIEMGVTGVAPLIGDTGEALPVVSTNEEGMTALAMKVKGRTDISNGYLPLYINLIFRPQRLGKHLVRYEKLEELFSDTNFLENDGEGQSLVTEAVLMEKEKLLFVVFHPRFRMFTDNNNSLFMTATAVALVA